MGRFTEVLATRARSSRVLSRLVHSLSQKRARAIAATFSVWLPSRGRVLDVGTGTGHLAEACRAPGRQVIGCDIVDLCFVPLMRIRADAAHLPFMADAFDAVLLVAVLHHMDRRWHSVVLREVSRVLRAGKRLILLEDTYQGAVERQLTSLFDSAVNFEFGGHPHSNRTRVEWTELIRGCGLRLLHESEFVAWYGPLRFRHGLIVAEKVT